MGQLKVTGFPVNSKGQVNACALDEKNRCSSISALFSFPFEVLAGERETTINFSPKNPDSGHF